MTDKAEQDRGGSTAPTELLFAMLRAGKAYEAEQTDQNLEKADALAELVKVAERLPVSEEQDSLSMLEFIAAATGFAGFDGESVVVDSSQVVAAAQAEVLHNTEAQQVLNEYMVQTFGWEFDFSAPSDTKIIALTQHQRDGQELD